MTKLWIAALAVLCVNLPFGYWRAGVRKFSLAWFLAVHLPVPAVIGIRFLSGLGFQPITYPVLVGAYFSGQILGARLRSVAAVVRRAPGEEQER
jgi:hypothetical protein